MGNKVIAAVPVATNKLIVWFDEGVSRAYDAEKLDIGGEDFERLAVFPDGSHVAWESGITVSADELFENGTEVDLVQNEKQRLLKQLSKIRRDASFSQTRLGEAAGIRQSVVSRIEGCEISPQINTLLKLLAPLGKTIAIVDLKEGE
jgi:DNA-binding XRE family transcriptional regulator